MKQAIYVMKSEVGPVKIGIAMNPKQRLTDIRVATPDTVDLAFSAFVKDGLAKVLEKRVHMRLAEYRLRGEWFRTPLQEAISAINDVAAELGIDLRENGEPGVSTFNLRMPEDEKRAIERAAYWARLSVSDYVRAVLREAAAAKLAEYGERASFLPPPKDDE